MISWATSGGHFHLIKVILGAKYAINTADESGQTALHMAAVEGSLEVVRLLLQVDAIDINVASLRGYTPVKIAVRTSNHGNLKALIEAGADVNYHVEGQDAAFYLASESGNLEVVQMLLKAGADVNCDVSSQGAAQREAAKSGRLEVFASLFGVNAREWSGIVTAPRLALILTTTFATSALVYWRCAFLRYGPSTRNARS